MNIKVKRLRDDAVVPWKVNETDAGLDLWILAKEKEQGTITVYDTGIAYEIEDTSELYYGMVVARSSLFKHGYMLANSVGIIDAGYRNSIKIPLFKFDTSMPDLKLPSKVAQLIITKIPKVNIVLVSELSETTRGTNGFGSSGGY